MRGTVLVVEDNELNVKLLKIFLDAHDFQVVVAMDGESAVRIAQETRPSLILMDLQLPKMDGLSAVRAIRSDPECRSIPIIAVTGFAMDGDRASSLEAGCDDYVSKPIDVDELLTRMERVLNR